ncbi:MAG TPA: phosphate/phosphite/phosphonate ABC transporter substrate-binding protein [Patescibacteria group bacterium]|nr:phosphate/phosphite/phosphonate ABC transporter substrate-binding protein [Patescibacteria group bacterium]
MLRVLLPVALCAALLSSSVRAEDEPLHFGLVASLSPQSLQELWQPLLDDMTAVIGRKVVADTYDDYAGVIWAMGADRVQIAWTGNKSAIEAVDRANAEVAFQSIDKDGRPGYWSTLIVPAASPLTNERDVLANAARLSFGYGDANSTSGYAVPSYYLFALNHVDPYAAFRRVMQGNHESNFLAVAEGRADVATSNNIYLEQFRERWPEKAKAVKVIWTSPLIPSDPILWRKTLPETLKNRIRVFFLQYGREAPNKPAERVEREKRILARMTWSGIKLSSDRQLIPIRQMELYHARLAAEADRSLSGDQRRQRLSIIDASLTALAPMAAR